MEGEGDAMKITQQSIQTLFNKMYKGLDKQGWKKSVELNGGCKYRGPHGLKCAIGQCIDDATAHDWDSQLNSEIYVITGLYYPRMGKEKLAFLKKAQQYHDSASSEGNMQNKFIDLAKLFNLKIPKGTL